VWVWPKNAAEVTGVALSMAVVIPTHDWDEALRSTIAAYWTAIGKRTTVTACAAAYRFAGSYAPRPAALAHPPGGTEREEGYSLC
jgi:hypothetical protein